MVQKFFIQSHWLLLVISLLISLALSLFLYKGIKKNFSINSFLYSVFISLRTLSFFLITILLLGIFIKSIKNTSEKPSVIIAVDNSKSIILSKDSSYVKQQLIKNLTHLKEKIGENYKTIELSFGGKTKIANPPLLFNESFTDIESLFDYCSNNFSNQNVGAMLLVSDGIYNKGFSPLNDIENIGFPIFSLAIGDTNENRDLQLQKVNTNQIAYLNNIFPVETHIKAIKAKGETAFIRLKKGNTTIAQKEIKITSDNFTGSCQFTVNANQKGFNSFVSEITILKNEKNIHNNSKTFYVEVIDSREKILLLAVSPHPDLSAIKDALSSIDNYEIETAFFDDYNKPLKTYNVAILHGFNSNATLIQQLKTANIPVFLINAYDYKIPGTIAISSGLNKINDAELLVNKSFGLFTISNELSAFLNKSPAIKVPFGNYQTSAAAQSLIYQKIGAVETENPVLCFSEINNYKIGIFAGEGLWRLKYSDFNEHQSSNLFTELITKSIQYLAVKNDKSFFRLNFPKSIFENTELEIDAELYNKAYEPINEPDVLITLNNTENKTYNYTFSKTERQYHLNAGILPPGKYNFTANVKYNNETYIKKGEIIVMEANNEQLNLTANHQLLNTLAYKTKGYVFYPNNFNGFSDSLMTNKNIKPITYTESSTNPLIDIKWLLILLLILFTSEWFLRKQYLRI
ncbi:MAG: hypothetical protein JSU07_13230 [Bacteroidetes bacterium]|nr:hypothetical protein [Bacteroidota bacterium]